jgi:hypothetical protein
MGKLVLNYTSSSKTRSTHKIRQHCISQGKRGIGRSQKPRGLRRGSAAARLLGLWIRISLRAWMSWLSWVLLIFRYNTYTRPEGVLPSVVCQTECDREASIMRRPWPTRGCCAMEKKNREIVVNNNQCPVPAFQHYYFPVAHACNGTSAAWWLIVMCLLINCLLCSVLCLFDFCCDVVLPAVLKHVTWIQ